MGERCFQVTRPDGQITPVYATSPEEAAQEFLEIVQDLSIQGQRRQQENWATALQGTTHQVQIACLQTGERATIEISFAAAEHDMHANFFPGGAKA